MQNRACRLNCKRDVVAVGVMTDVWAIPSFQLFHYSRCYPTQLLREMRDEDELLAQLISIRSPHSGRELPFPTGLINAGDVVTVESPSTDGTASAEWWSLRVEVAFPSEGLAYAVNTDNGARRFVDTSRKVVRRDETVTPAPSKKAPMAPPTETAPVPPASEVTPTTVSMPPEVAQAPLVETVVLADAEAKTAPAASVPDAETVAPGTESATPMPVNEVAMSDSTMPARKTTTSDNASTAAPMIGTTVADSTVDLVPATALTEKETSTPPAEPGPTASMTTATLGGEMHPTGHSAAPVVETMATGDVASGPPAEKATNSASTDETTLLSLAAKEAMETMLGQLVQSNLEGEVAAMEAMLGELVVANSAGSTKPATRQTARMAEGKGKGEKTTAEEATPANEVTPLERASTETTPADGASSGRTERRMDVPGMGATPST